MMDEDELQQEKEAPQSIFASTQVDRSKKGGGFQTMGLRKEILKGILHMGYQVPTPIQRKAIPPMLQGQDAVAMARTGSGKTAAFVIPMLHQLHEHSKVVGARALVLSPTRELSLQTQSNIKQLGKFTNLTHCLLVGGKTLESQFAALATNPDIIVAAPGRVLHMLEEVSKDLLTRVQYFILDEADRLFEQGLQQQIVAILHRMPDTAQRALFSATMPSVLAEFTEVGLREPSVIRLDQEMKLSDKLEIKNFYVRTDEKVAALMSLLNKVVLKQHFDDAAAATKTTSSNVTNKRKQPKFRATSKYNRKHQQQDDGSYHDGTNASDVVFTSQALVFVESKHHIDHLEIVLEGYNIPCAAVHGQMDQEARKLAVQSFTRRRVPVMVVSDVAARGLDIPLLDNVINFSFPFSPKLFIHRVGRVARAGRSGTAYSLVTLEDVGHYIDCMRFLNLPTTLPLGENQQQHQGDGGDFLGGTLQTGLGRFPDAHVQHEVDYLKKLESGNVELDKMARVVTNAHSKYCRTRKHSTKESAAEAKEYIFKYENIPLHPMFVHMLDPSRVAADEAIKSLRRFKPQQTVLQQKGNGSIFGKGEQGSAAAGTASGMFQIPERVTLQHLAAQERAAALLAGGGEKKTDDREKEEDDEEGSDDETKHTPAPKKLSLAESLLAKAAQRKQHGEEAQHLLHLSKRGRGQQGDDGAIEGTSTGGAKIPASLYAKQLGASAGTAAAAAAASNSAYRDANFFMPTAKDDTVENQHYSIKDATVDFAGETAADEAKRRLVFAWNKRKNKFVKMNISEAKGMTLGIKNESGKNINFSKGKKLQNYLKWTRTTNIRVQDIGEEEDSSTVSLARAAMRNKGQLKPEDEEAGGEGEGLADDDEDKVDISNPNQGKKLRIGRKIKRLPKDGRIKSFDEIALEKRKKQRDEDKLARRRAAKQQRRGGGGAGGIRF